MLFYSKFVYSVCDLLFLQGLMLQVPAVLLKPSDCFNQCCLIDEKFNLQLLPDLCQIHFAAKGSHVPDLVRSGCLFLHDILPQCHEHDNTYSDYVCKCSRINQQQSSCYHDDPLEYIELSQHEA